MSPQQLEILSLFICLFMFGKKCLAITPILGLLFTSLVTLSHSWDHETLVSITRVEDENASPGVEDENVSPGVDTELGPGV